MTPPILVTGAAGWLGRRLLLALVQGIEPKPALATLPAAAEIRCLARAGEDTTPIESLSSRVRIVRGDLQREPDVRRFCAGSGDGLLFHCAGLIHPALFTRDFMAVNVRGSERLLEAAVDAGVRRAVVMSSNSPLGTNPDRAHRFDESSPYRPYMGYGRSKMQLEELVARQRDAGRIETVVVRAPWFYGPAQPARQSEFFSMVRQGRAPIVGDGGNLRSMAYLDNLSQGLLLAALHPRAAGETYWIADRRPYTMNEIVDTIERVMRDEFGFTVAGRRLRLPGISSELALLADRLLQGAGLYVQKIHVLSELNKNIACRIDKAERELGYAPAIELEEGMRRSLRWCIDNGVRI